MTDFTHMSSVSVQGSVYSSSQGKLIGSFDTMPAASALNSGQIVLYTGPTGTYVKGTYYVSNGTSWSKSDATPERVTVDSELSASSSNPIQNSTVYSALNGKLGKSETAAKATADANGNNIASTYLTQNAASSTYATKTELSAYATKTEVNAKQDALSFDAAPTSGSANPVTSNGIYEALADKVDVVSGKGLSTNDYTTDEKNKLEGIAAGAQVNVIETIKVNGTAQTPSSKVVNIDLSNYATKGDVSAIPKFAVTLVDTLPASGNASTIYLKSNGGASGNSYDEYLYYNNAWEKIGSTEVDLSRYVPIERKINNKQLKTDIALTAGDVGALPVDGTAVKATADANGKNIADTYATQETVDGKQAKITGAATSITSANLTASRALVSDGNGKVAVSDVTSTELRYLDGVTSAIQAQIDGKQPTITGGASTIASSNLSPSRALVSDSSGKVGVSAVTSTELEYLDGVTGNIQSQLNSKISSIPSAGNSTKPIYINSSGVPTECNYVLGDACAKAVTTSVTSGSTSLVTSGGVYTAVSAKQDKLTFDTSPTSGSGNPVTSGGVYTAIAAKQDKLTFDSTPTSGSNNPVTSGGVFSAINAIPSITVDSALSSTSTNPIQNKVINTALSNKMDKVTSIGSSTKPIYINSSGVPTVCSYNIGAAASYGVTTSVTSGSSSLVTSGAVYTAINSAGGGEVWEEVNLSSFPTNWVAYERIKVAFRTYYASHVGSIKGDANKARTPTIEFVIPDSFTSMNFPLYSADPNQYLRINNIGGASAFNNRDFLFTLEAYVIENSSTAVADLTITPSNAKTYIYKMWRLKN